MKFTTRQVWAVDLAEMESLSSKNKNFKYLLCVINFSPNMLWLNLKSIKK